jgi:hypothetical protein
MAVSDAVAALRAAYATLAACDVGSLTRTELGRVRWFV